MKRSLLNTVIAQAEEDFGRAGVFLPAFGRWGVDDWRGRQRVGDPVKDCGLGWDVTDFGGGRFEEEGLLLFTVRNGIVGSTEAGNRPYAEKIMISRRDQLTPLHRHVQKVEDIINRFSLSPNALLAIRLFGMRDDGSVDEDGSLVAHLDGEAMEVAAGTVLLLAPGESITLFPGTYHAFWGEGGAVVVGEVSSVNDDKADNFFASPLARFSSIEEDAIPYRLLVNDYDATSPTQSASEGVPGQ
ncbi:D-lyxose/D-mannose family sugar isomerase [Lichenicola cladoniae]|uniref:D-lyxose ketol-isomerase n=1 Tax=Lichenicola cladoniae TaxID=1484109 RepID=A0A6M8HS91_9PROT|nr:D-lyxose/D-mannose family sugar isomerase [Lichenicola cladoniae]NPD65788.1 D-lyxose/D-mannose family sugar isomerase [Acetobacteraceae bacterium]QKE91200.1 D-lyxose/D-mannose family sugar isomerase [Lichenicola cladoniae]